MGKRIVLCLSLLFSCLSFGQGSEFRLTNFSQFINGDEDICYNDLILILNFRDGSTEELMRQNYGFEGTRYFPDIYRKYNDKIFESLDLFVKTIEQRGTSCNSDDPSIIQDTIIHLNYTPCPRNLYNVYQRNGGDFEVEHRVRFNYQVIPIPKIERIGSDIAGFDDPLRALGDNSFEDSVYRWQYQVTEFGINPAPSNWSDIPNTSIGKNLSVVPSTFLNLSEIGKWIHIRAKAPCSTVYGSNFITYILRKSAPHIDSVNSQRVSCFDAEDGEVTIYFDRALDDGDNLNITIFDLTIGESVTSYEDVALDDNNSITLRGLPSSGINGFRIDLITGNYNGEPYFTEGLGHTATFNINRPSYVAYDREPLGSDVKCYEGDDGSISISATGGVGGYEYLIKKDIEDWGDTWYPFMAASSTTITELRPGVGIDKGLYQIKIRDGNRCVAKEPFEEDGETKLGTDVVREISVGQPDSPLEIEVLYSIEPTAFGFEDGIISARIYGGTPFSNGSPYTFRWTDENNTIINTIATNSLSGDQGFEVILHSVPKGNYRLQAWDANYDQATNQNGCFYVSELISLQEPDPLEISVEVLNEISCNIDSDDHDGVDFNDPIGLPDQFQDGALVARVTGGVAFENDFADVDECRQNFMPYCYQWKKQVNGVWQDLPVNDSIIINQSVGQYAINIEDKNGIKLGVYEFYIDTEGYKRYRLSQEIDSLLYLQQPDKLTVSFASDSVTCQNGNDARIEALVSGGTPPYYYEWSTGAETSSINNLIAGKYVLYVTDSKGCELEVETTVSQPNGLAILIVEQKNPTCYEGDDGELAVQATGGTPPYTYQWGTGANTSSINSLSEGIYTVRIEDANECAAFMDISLDDPLPVPIDLGKNRTICVDQELVLDIGIDDPGATYVWSGDNGFNSTNALVSLTEAGIYKGTIITSLGCTAFDEVQVSVSQDEIDADFLLATQAYTDQEVILVNVSSPLGESVDWTVPEGIAILGEEKEKLTLQFDVPGVYPIQLRSYQGDCYQDYKKNIIVEQKIETAVSEDEQQRFIKELLVYPNPTQGEFTIKIALAEVSNVNVRVINLITSDVMNEREAQGHSDYVLDFTAAYLPSGVYLLSVETPNGNAIRKLVVD